VYRDGSVRSIQHNLGPAFQLESSLRALKEASPQGLDTPGDMVVLAGQAVVRPA
jgi:hypothetical protein